jgi:hypothetical protein
MTISTLIPSREFNRSVSHFRWARGWLSRNAAQVFSLCHAFQRAELGLTGDILEVGAHEGRSTIFFRRLLGPGETLHVNDLFDMQELNVSKSAGSSYAAWLGNVRRGGIDPAELRIYEGPSQLLRPEDLGRKRFRIAYLDGGHATDEVHADLHLAEGILAEGGVAVVDDTFVEGFPGTTEGLVAYLREEHGLAPLVLFEGKTALVTKGSYEAYRDLLLTRLDTGGSWFLPAQNLGGYEVMILRFNGRWEGISRFLKARVPGLHRTLRSSRVAQKAFHRARGAFSDTRG